MTSSYLSVGSAGLKPVGFAGAVCAFWTGSTVAASASAPLKAVPAAAAVVETLMKLRRERSMPSSPFWRRGLRLLHLEPRLPVVGCVAEAHAVAAPDEGRAEQPGLR